MLKASLEKSAKPKSPRTPANLASPANFDLKMRLCGMHCCSVATTLVACWLLCTLGCSEDQRPPAPIRADLPSSFVNTQAQRYVLIPGGTFQMGPEKPRENDQQPRHLVTLSSFYLAAFEVTKGQFRAFAKAKGVEDRFPELDPTALGRDKRWAYARAPGESFPAYYIDWETARDYAAWLSELDHRRYRLPREAEWEYAARAGQESWYWWGDEWKYGIAIERGAQFDRTPYAEMFIPGTTPANPWGLYEILGNAAEWTSDWYGERYSQGPVTDPVGPANGDAKVVRGGSVDGSPYAASVYFRVGNDPREPIAGIRLVCEITPDFTPPPPPPAHLSTLDRAPFLAAAARPADLTVELSPGVPLELMRIPEGSYAMGSPGNEPGHGQLEQPVTQVTISHAFLLGRYEVTQRQYEAVMGTNPSRFKDPARPVEQVSFEDIKKFFTELTKRERDAGRLTAEEIYRLPTEPEWEYACRAGSQAAYCYGDDPADLESFAWFDGRGGTHPVGQKLPNRWGLYDMHGNVQEWCWGSPRPHPGGTQVDPRRRPGALYMDKPEVWDYHGVRSARGGAWDYAAIACRSAMRQGFDGTYDFVGFRIARASTAVDVSVDDPTDPKR
jgi:formylglycine-generating enzyme required for sulfatase activity